MSSFRIVEEACRQCDRQDIATKIDVFSDLNFDSRTPVVAFRVTASFDEFVVTFRFIFGRAEDEGRPLDH